MNAYVLVFSAKFIHVQYSQGMCAVHVVSEYIAW